MTDGGTVKTNGIWTVHNRPRAIREDDKTFIATIGRNGEIEISSFDHTSETIQTTTLDTLDFVDDHSAPSLHMRDDGRLVVFWSKRGVDTMKWKISDNAYDVSSFGSLNTFTTSGANIDYPQPVEVGGNLRIYYRAGSLGDPWNYRESTDGGATWGSEQTAIDLGPATYVHFYKDGTKLHMASGDHREDNPAIRHWYLEGGDYYTSDGTLIQSEGTALSDPTAVTTVYDGSDTGNNPPKQWDLKTDGNGNPHVVFTEHVTTGTGGGDGDYRARWAKFSGGSWTVGSEITPMGGAMAERHYYPGGLNMDAQDPSTVYVSVEAANRNYQIQEWTTNDGGSSWSKQNLSPDGDELIDPTKRGRPISPRNHQGEMPVLWWAGRYNYFVEDYKTQIRRPI